MPAVVAIGEFSRLTHLSVKALRHYHDVGLLAPAEVDPDTGYRRYSVTQVSTAQLIRRLRELDMPIPGVLAVVTAASEAARDDAISEHLRRMEAELDRTRDVVSSLRSLLKSPPAAPILLEHRRIADLTALTLVDRVTRSGVAQWCGRAYARLYTAVEAAGIRPAGPAGATYDPAFFETDEGEVRAFLPVPAATPVISGLRPTRVAGGYFAVGEHRGAYSGLDRSYGAVGSHVAEHDTALAEPVREIYLVGPPETDPDEFRTEICWPISA